MQRANRNANTLAWGPNTSSASLPNLSKSSSMPSIFSADNSSAHPGIHTKKWTTETKRYLHQRRERKWLSNKAKHHCLDFSDSERNELKRYFSAVADSDERISVEQLENMLISFGLAKSRREVAEIVSKIEGSNPAQGLDFEEYLEIVRTRTDANVIEVFKAMMEGKLGDKNLNFQTVLSQYRRQLLIDATGARERARPEQQDLGREILHNFATLQHSRHVEAVAAAEAAKVPWDAFLGSSPSSAPAPDAAALSMPFDSKNDAAPFAGLKIVWRGVCMEKHLLSSRPTSAEASSRRTGEKPLSPRAIVEGIIKEPLSRTKRSRGTLIIRAPALEEGDRPERQGSKEAT